MSKTMSKFKGFLEAPGAEKQRQRRVDLVSMAGGTESAFFRKLDVDCL